jgi:MerR family transcriptional regulator, copper efflux regulator
MMGRGEASSSRHGASIIQLDRRARLPFPLDLVPRGQVYRSVMARDGLLIGEAAKQSGASRKALRLYEAAGILPVSRRTAAGYRVYSEATLDLLAFIRKAQRLAFTLEEIKEIVSIKREGRVPCLHVQDLVRRKTDELDRRLREMRQVRDDLRALLNGWRSTTGRAVICPHIERTKKITKPRRRMDHG